MKIYYQWFKWAYSNKASLIVAKNLNIKEEKILWVPNFLDVFNEINNWNIWVLPIENSYAGSVHENFYNIISGDYKIIWELYLDIHHFLLWKTKDKKKIKKVISHPQALMQCDKYIIENNFEKIIWNDTAWAAKIVSENNDESIASISSDFCAEVYSLNILDKDIQDQTWNTTRFFVIVKKDVYEKNAEKLSLPKVWKISIKFRTKDIPAALYKCLWAFATRYINLTKIESLPAHKNKFEYIFWIDFQKNVEDKIIDDALKELEFFSKDLVVLGKY